MFDLSGPTARARWAAEESLFILSRSQLYDDVRTVLRRVLGELGFEVQPVEDPTEVAERHAGDGHEQDTRQDEHQVV